MHGVTNKTKKAEYQTKIKAYEEQVDDIQHRLLVGPGAGKAPKKPAGGGGGGGGGGTTSSEHKRDSSLEHLQGAMRTLTEMEGSAKSTMTELERQKQVIANAAANVSMDFVVFFVLFTRFIVIIHSHSSCCCWLGRTQTKTIITKLDGSNKSLKAMERR